MQRAGLKVKLSYFTERVELLHYLPELDASVLWVRLGFKIDQEVLDCCPHLKYLVSATTGLDHLDVAERRGVKILSLQGEGEFLQDVWAAAEHTVALMLALLRKIPAASFDVTEVHWNRERFKGRELRGKKVLLVGTGRVAHQVEQLLQGFHCEVRLVEAGCLEAALPWADIVSIHLPNRLEYWHAFNRQTYRVMKCGAYLINTSRGDIIDQDDLNRELVSGHIQGAALDVVCGEPEHPDLRGLDYHLHDTKMVVTPHLGGCTYESMAKTEVFMAQKLLKELRGA